MWARAALAAFCYCCAARRDSLIGLGTTAVIDFGLAGLFERFEREFGRTVTRALLALIGVTIVVVSLGLIAQFLWALYQWTTDTIEGTSTVWLEGLWVCLWPYLHHRPADVFWLDV
jgi:hypothetical protein